MKTKKIIVLFLACILSFSLAACGSTSKSESSSKNKKSITVGTSAIFKDILEQAKPEFDKDGYTLNIKVFDDLVTPNTALQEGSIDMNVYQHEPYLNQFNKSKGTNLEKYGTGVLKYFMGIYSKKITNINSIKNGATVTIPNDASNRARALKVLQSNGLIKLKSDVATPTKLDIVQNTKNLNIVEMDVLKLVNSLNDADFSVINSIVASQGNINPKSAIGYEDESESNKYSIVIAIKSGYSNKEIAERLEKALKSQNVKTYIEKRYKGAIVPLF
ncbi:MetQ/NlpA family ABC transporter substrate-binding protein [Clostridium tyrobutyricum]|uniref:MetQ/NlpA family ABC transporter substrate-binding protein n=1 Tax=Clostridium tyrobutyricum TaxID=1519 RepID=UPI0002F40BFB|nr:MetQ/NlpA family ABC transporter substrate-binding protein [Clostridium tyrobutyricum]